MDVPPLAADCTQAASLSSPAPAYPPVASRNEIQGIVRVRFVVREDGSVSDPTPLSGPALLAEAAVAAIRTWRFTPAHCADRAVPSIRETLVPFVLRAP